MSDKTTIEVDTRAYLSILKPERIDATLSITLSNHSYLPRVDDLQSDWVAHVAAPAFKLYREQRGGKPVDSFASIGTGSGLDVLTGIELLGAKRVGLTDVHEDVVATAAANVAGNHARSHPVVVESGFGDLLKPLKKFNARYDVIYENLPNVAIDNSSQVGADRNSSLFLAPRRESVPELIHHNMLDLHYLALVEAKDFLASGGAVLSTIGGRIPLSVILKLGELAGYTASFQTYTWKIQADPAEVIGEHARKQKAGFGPFHFYKAEVLKEVFAKVDVAASGDNALAIEKHLLPSRLDASQAYDALLKGEKIGHTVAVLKSQPK